MSNPIQDKIWVRGVSPDNAVYEVALKGTNNTTYLYGEAFYRGTISYAPPGYPGTEQLTGPETQLAGAGYKAAYLSTSGTVVQVPDAGLLTGPLWLYLHKRTTDTFPGQSFWTRQGYSARQQGVDIQGNSDVVSVPGDINSSMLYPAIGDNGQLTFENSSVLAPGRYRLTLDTGNIGRVDSDFEGFNVELNLNANVVQTTLLSGGTGFNPRGVDVIELDIVTPQVVGTWLFNIRWSNALRDTTKGTMRQLAVYGYYLEKLATELFKVEINPVGVYCEVLPVSYDLSVPGGWLGRLNSYGTVVVVAHEGTIYPRNDTVVDRFPLGDILTGDTNSKMESIEISSIAPLSFCTAGTHHTDVAGPAMPVLGVLIDSLVP